VNIGVIVPERRQMITLSDRRALAWSEWAPVDGIAVLFCTGAAMSGELGFGEDALDSLALRLIAIDRPGLGRSDAHPNKTLWSWVDDAKQLITAEGLHNTVPLSRPESKRR